MSKIYLDIDLSLETDSSNIVYIHSETNEEISYEKYLKLDEDEQDYFVLDCIQSLIQNSNITEYSRIDISTSE